MSASSPEDSSQHRKKRVGKACDSCRIKKTKCDGKKPCSRCIADNKLCAFTEKRRSKEKAHPSGYIELLETRIDLLTRSLSKVVLMAEPHLPFLSQLMESAKYEHSRMTPMESESSSLPGPPIPINEVVSYLISEMNLLADEPAHKLGRAQAAANMSVGDFGRPIEQNHEQEHEYGHDFEQNFAQGMKESRNNSPEDASFPFEASSKYGPDYLDSQVKTEPGLRPGLDMGSVLGPELGQDSSQTFAAMPEPKRQSAQNLRLAGGSTTSESRSLFQHHGSSPPSRTGSPHSLQSVSNESYGALSASKSGESAANKGRIYNANTPFGGFLNSPPTEHQNLEASSLDSFEQAHQYGSRTNSLFNHASTNMSTSPSSVSSLSVKLENSNFDDPARQLVRRSHSARSHSSTSFVKRKSSGHVHKPHTFSHPSHLHSGSVSASGGRSNSSQSLNNHPFQFMNTTQRDLTTQSFDFGNELLFSEPPSKMFAEGVPLLLENDDLGMTNPFLSSFT